MRSDSYQYPKGWSFFPLTIWVYVLDVCSICWYYNQRFHCFAWQPSESVFYSQGEFFSVISNCTTFIAVTVPFKEHLQEESASIFPIITTGFVERTVRALSPLSPLCRLIELNSTSYTGWDHQLQSSPTIRVILCWTWCSLLVSFFLLRETPSSSGVGLQMLSRGEESLSFSC